MNSERRRDRLCRAVGLMLACAILGPPFVVVCYFAVSGMRGES